MTDSVGSLNCNLINWPKAPAYSHSTAYRQPGRNGNGHVGGVVYADASLLTATILVTDKTMEKGILDQAVALCAISANPHTVTESTEVGEDIVTDNVFVESFKVVKSNACVGPGSSGYIIILAFTVYMPVGG